MPEETLTNRQRAIQWIPALIDEGYGNEAIISFLREEGFGYRTSNMRADINRLRLEGFGAASIMGLTRDTPIPDLLMKTWEGSVEHAYRVLVKYEYIEDGTGLVKTEGTTMYFDHNPSQAEVTEFFQSRRDFIEAAYSPIRQVLSPVSVQYFKNVRPGEA